MGHITGPLKAVVFDFDYTLADSSSGAIDCFRYAFRRLGLPAAPDDEIRDTIGLSLADAFRQLVDPSRWTDAGQFALHFRHRADQVVAARTVLYASVPNVLQVLCSRGLRLAIVSNKYRYRVRSILRREAIADRFDVVTGSEDVEEPKPDPRGLLLTLGTMGCLPAEALYVGDSVVDAETAGRAGVAFAAVLSGVTPVTAFRDFEPRVIIRDLGELPDVLHG